VCPDFAEAARLEGTARLVDGRMINIGGCSCAGGYDCFVVLDTDTYPWGMGNRSNPLEPFVSVATDTDVIASGTILYSPEIDGVALPAEMGGGTHDGCLRADDVGGGITGMHIDFFAALRAYYVELDPLIPENVTLYTDPPRCDI
jgi:3D (Asp-Asp-Asp) domain-containing protein